MTGRFLCRNLDTPTSTEGDALKNYLKEQREKATKKRDAWVMREHKKGRTQTAIAKDLEVTPQRIGQIIAKNAKECAA